MDYLLILIGFVLLILGANYLVDGASGLAKRFRVSNLIIGLTVVAFGTSMPELVVNVMAVLKGTSEIALTNIIGSNIINTYVILGVTALIYPIVSQRDSRLYDMPFSAVAGFLVLTLVWFSFGPNDQHAVSTADGIVLLLIFSGFMFLTVRRTVQNKDAIQEESGVKPRKVWLAIVMIIGGLAGLVWGGNLIVESSIRIATQWGVSESIVGLTIVALGTSLPELATSAMAAFKKNADLALGNVLGSNIFNVFFVLGISSVVAPLPYYQGLYLDSFVAGMGTLLMLLFVSTNRGKKVLRWQGGLLLLIYTLYLTYTIVNMV